MYFQRNSELFSFFWRTTCLLVMSKTLVFITYSSNCILSVWTLVVLSRSQKFHDEYQITVNSWEFPLGCEPTLEPPWICHEKLFLDKSTLDWLLVQNVTSFILVTCISRVFTHITLSFMGTFAFFGAFNFIFWLTTITAVFRNLFVSA